MGSILRHKHKLFRIFESGSLWKASEGGKDHIQENVNGKHLKEGHMIRNCSNNTDLQHMFYSMMHGNQTFSMTNSC